MRGHFVSERKLENTNHVHRFGTRHAERGTPGMMPRVRSCITLLAIEGFCESRWTSKPAAADIDLQVLILVDAPPNITEVCGSSAIEFETLSTAQPHGHTAWRFLCGPPYHDMSLLRAIFNYCEDKCQRDLLQL